CLGVAPGAGGVAAGGEPAAPLGPVKSADSGNLRAAARARTAADTAGLERGTGDCAELAGPPACEGFSAAMVG
ncbi:MAG TPA: HlyD family secretion protein, partial [Polyangia bacterium]|nr:HlyD family secretion protein [Polyangia bacterium]